MGYREVEEDRVYRAPRESSLTRGYRDEGRSEDYPQEAPRSSRYDDRRPYQRPYREREITMTIAKKDKKTTIKMKGLAEMIGGETEEAMEQRELEPMATGAEKHENTARRFHAWGNLL